MALHWLTVWTANKAFRVSVDKSAVGRKLWIAIHAYLYDCRRGNLAASMANISVVCRRAGQGTPLTLNAGVRNCGVSVVQSAAPIGIILTMFGALVELAGVNGRVFTLLLGIILVSLPWMYSNEIISKQNSTGVIAGFGHLPH